MTKIKFIRYIAYNKARCKPVGEYREMKREVECQTDEIPVGVGFDEMGRVLHTVGADYDKTKFKNLEVREN